MKTYFSFKGVVLEVRPWFSMLFITATPNSPRGLYYVRIGGRVILDRH